MMAELTITTTEMHTDGEPVRIIESGIPEIPGKTLMDKMCYIRDNLDFIRKLVIYEPRGHHDMVAVILVSPDIPGSDIACIFMTNDGYCTMCGHGTIALGRYAVDKGLVKSRTSPETRVVMQCPCGPMEIFVEYRDGKAGAVRFNSVPAFVFKRGVGVEVPGYGHVTVDISYGGAFYAIVPAERLGLDVKTSAVQELQRAAGAVSDVLKRTLKLSHPDGDELAFLHSTLITDGNDEYSTEETASVNVFADRQVDRSPCGSGVTARVALQFARGLTKLNRQRTFVGPTGGKFKAQAVRETKCGPYDAVIVEVSGKGYYTGTCTFTREDDDEIGKGFLLK